MLTQVARDPGTSFFGACDRNWWHYKIRDFPSIILQQAGYALAVAADLQVFKQGLEEGSAHAHLAGGGLLELAAATARFWNQRAVLHGAFEEYYPYEQGYPPAAFSTLAVAKLCKRGVLPLSAIRPGLQVAADQLLSRFEEEAANQQIAGTAALAVLRSLDANLIDEITFQRVLSDTMALQHDEGWYPEYHGPDLGYLAVSIDCLWDIFDHTGETRVRNAILKAADFTAWFALGPLAGAGMHNSRNTDYFTPYGLVRLALEEPSGPVPGVVHALFSRKTTGAFHPFDAVDDRYWCHYIGHSVFRALQLIEGRGDVPAPAAQPRLSASRSWHGSGHVVLGGPGRAALVSTRKGAITTAMWGESAVANDFGWVVQAGGKQYVNHWWSNDWHIDCSDTHASCEGFLVSHADHLSTPWKHMVLRAASFLFGRKLIRLLKRLVIFKKPAATHGFSRRVFWNDKVLMIRDEIRGLQPGDEVIRAPRFSKRHVASADSFHPEDLTLFCGCGREEMFHRENGIFSCETEYRLL